LFKGVTVTNQENQSEVAKIRRQIAAEYEAAQRALHDVAMVGRHAFITARQENIGVLIEALVDDIGIEGAAQVWASALEQSPDVELRC